MLRAVPLLAVVLTSLTPAVASAARTSVRAPESVREGARFAVTGKVRPVRRGLKAVLVDESGHGLPLASPKVRVKPSGRYALRSFAFYDPSDPPLRVHVLRRNGTVYSRSAAFTVDLDPVTRDTFRAVYAITSDQPGPSHPTPGTSHPEAIAHEAEVASNWFMQQTALRPRWRRDPAGRVQVTTVRVGGSAEDYAGDHETAMQRLRRDIDAKLDLAAGETPVIWIDAGGERTPCGAYYSFPWQLVIWERACDMYPEADSTFPWGGATHLLTHEMTHAFGAVYVCAPHSDGTGHVNDDPNDILYAGPEKGDMENLVLDAGRDDYFMTGRPDCPGIQTSALWERNAER